MKVLVIAPHFPPYHAGGYGAVAERFAAGLAKRGHAVSVLAAEAVGDAVGDTPALPVERRLKWMQGESPWPLFRNNVANVNAVRRSIRNAKPDVILSCGNDGVGFSCYHAAIASGVPSLTYLGDTWLAQAWRNLRRYDAWAGLAGGSCASPFKFVFKRALGSIGTWFGLLDADAPPLYAPVTAISRFVVEDLRASNAPVPAEVPMTYIPLAPHFFTNDGDPVGGDGTVSATLRVLFVSRMEPLKGPDVAVAAVAAAVRAGHDVILKLAGMRCQDMWQELTKQAVALGVVDHVWFAGTPDPLILKQLYRSHDVFLFPSRIVEGLGIVNCEAQACGLPIIGVADSGAAEVIRDGETGFRIAIDDSAAIGRHLGTLAIDSELRKKLSANALHSAKRFHPDRILDTLEAALKAVLR